MFGDTQHWLKNLKEKNWLVVSKIRIWRILIRALKSLKNLHFDWSFPAMFDLKKYRGVIFHDTRKWFKIWRKTNLWFGKYEEFCKFSPEHFNALKLRLWWDFFVQSWKCMSWKFTGELCVMIMKNDAKIEEKLTFQLKIGMTNLMNFDPRTQKSQKFAL